MSDDEMIAGFHSATRSVLEEKRKAIAVETEADKALKKARIRGTRIEARDPKSKGLIESNELRRYVDRLVALSNEKAEVQDAMKVVFAQAKDAGYDVPALRLVLKRALEDEAAKFARQSAEDIAAAMMAALGMLADTPLGEAALAVAAE